MNKYVKYVSILIMLIGFAAVGVTTAAGLPTVAHHTPDDGETDVPISTTISVTFSEAMNKTATNDAFSIDHSVDLSSFSWTGNTVTCSPTADLAYDTIYHVTIGTGAENTSGTSLTAPYSWDFTTESAGDTTAPTVTDHTPGDGETDVPISTMISVTFSEAMNKTATNDAFSIDHSVNLSSFSWTGNTVTCSPTADLADGTTYHVTIGTGAKDQAGNNLDDDYSWDFTTESAGDTTAPTVTDHTPGDGETDVPISTDITVTFSEAMNKSLTNDSFSIDPEVDGSFDWDDGDTIMTFNPDDNLAYNTTYEVTIGTGAESSDGTNLAPESKWEFTTESAGHSTGFRIWDAGRKPPMDLNYTWDARSFTGFYYDLDDDTSTETLTIKLDDYDDRTIDEDDLKYITTAADIDFEHDDWGEYKVIGFMAEKYFAGYEKKNTSIADEDISLISKDMLSKVLIDEDEKHTVSTGASLELKEGYELKIIQLDIDGGQAQVELVKNGKSVDTDIVTSPDNYIYEKDLGKLDDVPLVVVRITSVFAGTESDMLVIEGIFQVSDDIIPIDTGDEYDEMEIKSSSRYTIEMRNMDDIDLEEDETVDIMGNLKFIVADSETLRFALYEDITSEPGTHDIRGTVYNTTEKPTWDHMNFEGFYYDIDDNLGTEELRVENSGNTIDEDNLIYTTTPNLVRFEFDDWGSYEVIGFMAEPYFAGYDKDKTSKDITHDDISLISKDMLSKVLIDVEDKRMVSTGASLQLEEGYELRIVQLDVDGGQAQFELLKNGKSVDTDIVTSPDTYVYEKDLGKLDDVPIVAVRISSVFAGTESDMVVIEAVFQISDDPISIDTGDEYGEMEITSATSSKIEMKNKENVIDLDGDETIMITDNIGFKVSEDEDRYYLFVRRTVGSLDSLEIDFSENPVVKEELTITVTAASDGDPVEGAEVTFEGQNLGLTDSNGEIRFTSEEAGTFAVAATKENYDSASEDVRILTEEEAKEEEQKDQLVIEMPDKVDPGDDVVIKVTSNGSAIEGANITWDGDDIGKTDNTGSLTYTTDNSGTYTVIASKDDYLDASGKITVVLPSAKFELSDLTLPDEEVPAKKEFPISVDVTNTGDLEGTYLAELTIDDGNGTVVTAGRENVTLDVGETKTVEFTYKIAEAGTYTVAIGTESGELSVKSTTKSKTTLVAAILIVLAVLGAIGYVLISSAPEGGWTAEKLVEEIKEKFQREKL